MKWPTATSPPAKFFQIGITAGRDIVVEEVDNRRLKEKKKRSMKETRWVRERLRNAQLTLIKVMAAHSLVTATYLHYAFLT